MRNESGSSLRKGNIFLGLQFLSDFGDQITTGLLALSLLDITKSTGHVGLVYFVTTVGYVLFTIVGGMLGDRINKRALLVSCDIGRGFLVLLMIVALNQKSIGLIYLASFLLSILGSLHRPVRLSTWAESIPNKYLERYNSLSELSIQASTILGPLIASFFVIKNWVGLGFAVDSLTFFLCALVFFRVVSGGSSSQQSGETDSKQPFWIGFKLITQRGEMLRYISYDAIQMIGFGAFNATFLVLAQRDFAWSKVEYSYHLSMVAIFTTIGAFLGATGLIVRMNPATKLVACSLISSIALWVSLHFGVFPTSSIFIGICNGLSVLTMATTRTKVQLLAKESFPGFLSSIIAARSVIIKAATLFGTGACLLIDDFISLQATLVLFVFPIALSIVPFSMSNRSLPMLALPSSSKILD